MSTKIPVKFGKQPTKAPPGNFREIIFPQLALLEEGTKEGFMSRILHADGGSARALPRTIYFQKTQVGGHEGSVAIGSLHEVTMEGNILSGKGWLANVPEAHDALPFIISKALHHNSVDLSEVKVREEVTGDWFGPDFKVELHFDEWKLAATTLVGKPAFADAHAIIPDELTAALASDAPVSCDATFDIRIVLAESDEEILASATGLPRWDYFHVPESDPQKIVVGAKDEYGYFPVFGHLGLWNSCHDGAEGTCLTIPRPRDNYASFNKAGVLTDKGQIETGPIALYGGHVPLAKAFDDPANAWCDVRVTAGKHGPWVCGVVRPGTSDDKVYAARASRISGHWKGGRLKAIVSCNAEGYDVPGSGFSVNEQGLVDELVASFPGCSESKELPPPPPTTIDITNPATPIYVKGPAEVLDRVRSMNFTTAEGVLTYLTELMQQPIQEDPPDHTDDFEMARERLRLKIALDLDDDSD